MILVAGWALHTEAGVVPVEVVEASVVAAAAGLPYSVVVGNGQASSQAGPALVAAVVALEARRGPGQSWICGIHLERTDSGYGTW
jgi:hypothetical protein